MILLKEILIEIKENLTNDEFNSLEEFLNANEFGICLETIHDFILEKTIKIKSSTFTKIKNCSALMNIEKSIYEDLKPFIFY